MGCVRSFACCPPPAHYFHFNPSTTSQYFATLSPHRLLFNFPSPALFLYQWSNSGWIQHSFPPLYFLRTFSLSRVCGSESYQFFPLARGPCSVSPRLQYWFVFPYVYHVAYFLIHFLGAVISSPRCWYAILVNWKLSKINMSAGATTYFVCALWHTQYTFCGVFSQARQLHISHISEAAWLRHWARSESSLASHVLEKKCAQFFLCWKLENKPRGDGKLADSILGQSLWSPPQHFINARGFTSLPWKITKIRYTSRKFETNNIVIYIITVYLL